MLAACDHLRDASLPPLGVSLEDAAAGAAAWKLRDPAELRRDAEEKARKAEEKAAEKAAADAARAKKEADKLALARVRPQDLFSAAPDASSRFSAYDGDGVPTHDAAGVALGDKALKKLKKEWAEQQKLHEWGLQKEAAAAAAAATAAAAAAAKAAAPIGGGS